MGNASLNETAVREALGRFLDPESGRSVVERKQVESIQVDGGEVRVTLGLTSATAPLWDDLRRECVDLLKESLPEAEQVRVDLVEFKRPPEPVGEFGLRVKHTIVVGSGKGGVGKSTVATLLALGLKAASCKVGMLDADLCGPSLPHLLGVIDRPEVVNDKIQPILAAGMPTMSMGMLMPNNEAAMWRGPMLHGALTQLIRDTAWGDLDYLVVDMPPGTGDVPMSLAQLLPLSGAVVVCTPQPVALIDAVRAITMFRKADVRVLGMVENMSHFVCPSCDAKHHVFGDGGAAQKAEELKIPLLGELPLNIEMRSHGDEGLMGDVLENPVVRADTVEMCRRLVRVFVDEARRNPPMPQLNVL